MNIPELRTTYLKRVHAKRIRTQARDNALALRTDAGWNEFHQRQRELKVANKEYKKVAKKFTAQIAGDTELLGVLVKFYAEREAANKIALDAVRQQANVIIPGDKQ